MGAINLLCVVSVFLEGTLPSRPVTILFQSVRRILSQSMTVVMRPYTLPTLVSHYVPTDVHCHGVYYKLETTMLLLFCVSRSCEKTINSVGFDFYVYFRYGYIDIIG
jgi:hypothetical protein